VTGSQASAYTRAPNGNINAFGLPSPSPSPPNYFPPNRTASRHAVPVQIPKRVSPLPSPPKTPSPEAERNPLHSRSQVLDFLARVFPRSAVSLLPHTRGVNITSYMEGQSADWDGAVIALPGRERALYVDGAGVENVHLKECIVALMELGDEHLQCTSLVISLRKSSPDLGEVLHAMMYVGGSVVTRPPFPIAEDYILVGMSL